MLSILLASSGLAAVEGDKSPLCDITWIKTASLEDITEKFEAGITCSPGREPLHLAAAFGSLEVVKLLTDHGYDINARTWQGASPLHAAAQHNPDTKVIDFLVERGSEINARDDYGRVPLHIAAGFNPRLDVLQALLDHGADPLAKSSIKGLPDVQESVPFHNALFTNPNLEIVKVLYKPEFLEVRLGINGLTPLMIAGYKGRIEPVEFLIDKGVEINAQSNSGFTALHEAVSGSSSSSTNIGDDHLSVVQILLDNGADVSIRDNYFESALHKAFIGSDLQPDMAVVSALLNHGSDPSDINDVPCIAQINDLEYKIPAGLIALLEERGVAKIGPSVIDHLSCFKKRALAFVRNFRITNYST